MEPETPTLPRPAIDEARDSRIIREHRESLAAELAALVEDQEEDGAACPADEPAPKRENRKRRY